MKKPTMLFLSFLLIFHAGILSAWANSSDGSKALTLQVDDVGVTAILSPPESFVQGITYPLKAEVTNFGSNANTFDVVFDIFIDGTSTLILSDTTTVILMAGGTVDLVTFTKTFTPALSTDYQLISYTVLGTDENPANNTTVVITSIYDQLAVWYGKIDGSPLQSNINSRITVETFVYGGEEVWVADIHLCLGADSLYIDSMLSRTEGTYYYPFTEWDMKEFLSCQGSPPNPAGWMSQSFIGFARLIFETAPWLHPTTPIKVLDYVVKTANDPTLVGLTVDALGKGINSPQGPSNAGDSLGDVGFAVLEHFSPVYFRGAGHVVGTVTDEFADPIQGIVVVDQNTGKTDITLINGHYTLNDLFPGLHDISFSHPNYRDTIVTGVSVTANHTTTLNVQMQPLPFHDVGVSRIVSPPQFVQLDTNYPLKSQITNYGTAISTFDVIFEAYILGSPTPMIVDTFNVIDMPGNTVDTIIFDEELFTSVDTTYNLISYSLLGEDIDASNDTSTSTSSIFFGVSAWYGNLDSSPMLGYIDDRLEVDVYIQTIEDIYLSFIHLCLGADNSYIAGFLSQDEGEYYYPFTEWDVALFTSKYGSPPNPYDWSSQSFWALNSLGAISNPWLHFVVPTKALTFVVQTVNDPTLLGDTVNCLGTGLNPSLGPSSASDTLISQNYPIIEVFSPVFFKAFGFITGTVTDQIADPIPDVYVAALITSVDDSTDIAGDYFLDSMVIGTYDILFSHPIYRDTIVTGVEVLNRQFTVLNMVMKFPCDYTPGDVNSDGLIIGSDATYLIRYLSYGGNPPPDSCYNEVDDNWLYSAADVNGDCRVIGSDGTYLINYLRSIVGEILFCPHTPPPGPPIFKFDENKIPVVIPQVKIAREDGNE